MNVGEYNTLDLVKDNYKDKNLHFCIFCTINFEMQEEGHYVLFQPRHNLYVGH
jgi:hypothetical protein